MTEPVDAKLKPSSSLRGRSSAAANRGLANDDGSVLDVLSVWTRKAECRNSGLVANCYESTAGSPQGQLTAQTEDNMRGTIDLAVSETNTAYELSGVLTELRLVHAYRDNTYVESSSDAFGTALGQVRSTTDGIMDDVHTKRQTYGADIVAMIIDDSQYCGIAYLGPSYGSMFSVTSWNCATGYYSFGHEIGHNMVSVSFRTLLYTYLQLVIHPSTYLTKWYDIHHCRDVNMIGEHQTPAPMALPVTDTGIPVPTFALFSPITVIRVSVMEMPEVDALVCRGSRIPIFNSTARLLEMPKMTMLGVSMM